MWGVWEEWGRAGGARMSQAVRLGVKCASRCTYWSTHVRSSAHSFGFSFPPLPPLPHHQAVPHSHPLHILCPNIPCSLPAHAHPPPLPNSHTHTPVLLCRFQSLLLQLPRHVGPHRPLHQLQVHLHPPQAGSIPRGQARRQAGGAQQRDAGVHLVGQRGGEEMCVQRGGGSKISSGVEVWGYA